ncbi:hypothetical protein HOE425_331864 [Hoeflea sp. EC-HK425]|nr:hypothetical protein HOE425_331864 [Hoeflea sp. EC-HK425]
MNSTLRPPASAGAPQRHTKAGDIIQIANGAGVYILVYVEVSNRMDILGLKSGPHP